MIILNNTVIDSNISSSKSEFFTLFNLISVNYKIPLGCLISIISFIAIFGNLLVIAAIVVDKSLRTVSNIFILSLSISDLMIGLFVMPLSGTIIIFDKWLWGPHICRSWLSIDYIASTASIFNLFTLSVERYLSITYPLKFMTYQSKSKAKIAVLIVWLTSSLWIIPINLWSHFFKDKQRISIENNIVQRCTTDFETDKIFKIVTTIFNFYVPCIGMIAIYSKIFITIIKRSRSEIGIFCFSPYNKCSINESGIKKATSKSSVSSNNFDSCTQMRNKKISVLSEYHVNRKRVTFKKKQSVPSSSSNSESFQSKKNFYIQSINKNCGDKLAHLNKNSNKSRKNFNFFSFINCRGECKSGVDGKDLRHAIRRNALIEKYPTMYESNHSFEIDQIKQNKGIFSILDKFVQRKRHDKYDVYSARLKQQIKAAKQLGILILAFLITWMPYFITFIVVAFCSDCISDNLSAITLWLGYLNSAINPILYPQCNSSFKHAFRRMLRISPKRRKN
ncbi:histamine H1 receptor, partial [Brachionus plicatilis]